MNEAFLEININALKNNFLWFKSKFPFVCPMVKANAYGVGDKIVFEVLNKLNPDAFGVARLSEGLNLRKLDSKAKILLFSPCETESYKELITNRITPVISTFDSLSNFKKCLNGMKIDSYPIHIEVDTGMNRLGFKTNQLPKLGEELLREFKSKSTFKIEGVFSHFLKADDWPVSDGRSVEQMKRFKDSVVFFEKLKLENPNLFLNSKVIYHLSSSRAANQVALDFKDLNDLGFFGARPGLGLYGVSQSNSNLQSVLSLKAPLLEKKWIDSGESVSYDGLWRAQRKSCIGVLPIGYADGYTRSLKNKAHVYISGKKFDVVGLICMDFMMVDLTDYESEVKVGDIALIFGKDGFGNSIAIEQLSEHAGLVSYEFLTGLSSRLKRVKVEN